MSGKKTECSMNLANQASGEQAASSAWPVSRQMCETRDKFRHSNLFQTVRQKDMFYFMVKIEMLGWGEK